MSGCLPVVPLLLVMLLLGLGCEGTFDCSAVADCLTTENTVDCFGQFGRDDCLTREHTFDGQLTTSSETEHTSRYPPPS